MTRRYIFLFAVSPIGLLLGCATITDVPKPPDSTDSSTDENTDTELNTDTLSDSSSEGDTTTEPSGEQWNKVSARSFWMGTPGGNCLESYPGGSSCMSEPGRGEDEELHYVKLTHDFFLLRTEVTQGEFEAVMGHNPSHFGPDGDDGSCDQEDCPVENVSWFDAVAYANWLSLQEGLRPCYVLTNVRCAGGTSPSVGSDYMRCFEQTSASGGGIEVASVTLYQVDAPQKCISYRLPTESEWEYAARAETLSAYANGGNSALNCEFDPNLDAIGWYCGNALSTTKPVSSKEANDWDFFDMSGNVWEWTWDFYGEDYPAGTPTHPVIDPFGPASGDRRVARGGAFDGKASAARSGTRTAPNSPGYRAPNLGFRVARTALSEIDTETGTQDSDTETQASNTGTHDSDTESDTESDTGSQDSDTESDTEPDTESDTGSQQNKSLADAKGRPTGLVEFALSAGALTLYVDGDYDSGGWVLIGRGREGWAWTDEGMGDSSWIATGLGTAPAFSPIYLPAQAIQELIDNAGVDLRDAEIRIKRAAAVDGGAYQEVLWRSQSTPVWTWLFDAAPYDIQHTVMDSVLGAGAVATVNTRDTWPTLGGNDHQRIFTWDWENHFFIKGFSYGGNISIGTNDASNFLWQHAAERHSIPYSEVYLRIAQS